MTRWVVAVCALFAALVTSGCAALQGPTASSAPAVPSVRLVVDAPDPALKRLLETHLDLARLAVVAPGEAVSEVELRRLEAATPAQARALLETEGYAAAEVRVARETQPGQAAPLVRVTVQAGARARIARVALDVQGPLATAAAAGDADAQDLLAQWRKAWALPVGSAFRNDAWRAAKSAALAQLRAAGYAATVWNSTAAEIDAETAGVQVEAVADSGPLYRTGELLVVGLERQSDDTVRNLAGFGPGTPATEALLLDYQERLQRAGLYDQVSITLDLDPAAAERAAVTVRLRELALQQATLGAGISANTGPRITLEHQHRRIAGQRATLRNKLEWGRLRQAWDAELSSHAQPGLYRNLLGTAIERIESDTDRVTSLRARVGRTQDTQRIERLQFVEVERVSVRPRVAGIAGTDTDAATLNLHLVWRNVDSVVLPTDGVSLALQSNVGLARTVGARGGAFSRLYGRAQWWRPIARDWHAQARVELGQVFAASRVTVPDTQRFRAGGDDSVRGYAYRTLAPQVGGVVVGGSALFTASAELAHPLSTRLPSLWGALFVDAGNAAARWGDLKPSWGAGVGLRWRSPVGPLRVDVAYGEAVRQWRLHLSMGIAY